MQFRLSLLPKNTVFLGKLSLCQFFTDLESDSGVPGTLKPCIPYERGCKISIFTKSDFLMDFRSALDPKMTPRGLRNAPSGLRWAPLWGKRRYQKAFQKVVQFRKARSELWTTPPPETERGATCFACSQEGNPFLEAWGEGKFTGYRLCRRPPQAWTI